ncbi:hypothetical protein MKEN_00748200 [Mycena kentingensis (nom. inval.)]|nr:hypothetical protein MKEN_00748200 [Mycena kentingensis (nom. inval.)]
MSPAIQPPHDSALPPPLKTLFKIFKTSILKTTVPGWKLPAPRGLASSRCASPKADVAVKNGSAWLGPSLRPSTAYGSPADGHSSPPGRLEPGPSARVLRGLCALFCPAPGRRGSTTPQRVEFFSSYNQSRFLHTFCCPSCPHIAP